jgi:hypothetical protein
MTKKTDNHNPAVKLRLRQYFLNKYHANGSAKVLDCCQAGGVMWTTLRRTHPVTSYWGVDMKPKKGRLQIDSVRILQQPGLSQNIIDIDTYGSPWKHWFAVLPNIHQPTTIFLTIGSTMFKGATDGAALAALGCTFQQQKLPDAFRGKLDEIGVSHSLARGCDFVTMIEAVEAVSTGNARYIGLRVAPKKDGQQVATADRPTPSVERN